MVTALIYPRNCPDLNWNMLRDHLGTRDVIVATEYAHLIDHLKLGLTTNFIDCGTVDALKEKTKSNSRSWHALLEKICLLTTFWY